MRKGITNYLLLVILCSISAQSCKKDDSISSPTIENDPPTSTSEVPQNYFTTESNSSGFSDRISYFDKVIMWDGIDEDKGGLTTHNRSGDDYSDIFWLHVADVEPFVFQNETLSATHVDFIDDKAYVSYHKRGDQHLGALEVIDLSNPDQPVVVWAGYLSSADINAIKAVKDPNGTDVNVYLALSDANKGAVLGEVKFENGDDFNGFSIVNLSNFIDSGITSSANAVSQSGDYLYVSSGKTHGGVFCLDSRTLEVLGAVEFQNGKYIDVNGIGDLATKVVSLQTGDEASIRTEDMGGFSFGEEFTIGSILHQNVDVTSRGKSVLHFTQGNPDEVYVSMGMDGLKRFNIYTGEETWQSPADMITSGNTNGMTSDGEFIYVANGADGLTVFTEPEMGGYPERVFHWDLDDAETASANMVETHGEWIFVAKGQGGVKILKRPQPGDYLPIGPFDDQGTPDNLTDDQEICTTLLSNIFTSHLPEGININFLHPEYFTPDVPSSILLSEEAEISVTFVHEGAGYKNVLGYYYYDADNPPATVEDIQKLIVFPNASAEGSGGGLLSGNTVELLGNFKANTVVGFFLNANGWNGSITQGYWAHYTDYNFNQNNMRQSVLMHDPECGATVISFEDIFLPQSDKDFNDVMFQINCYPESAMDVSSFIQLH